MENKNEIMEHLRATLLKDIKLQEEIRTVLKKTLRRYTIILATVSVAFIILLSMIIYLVKRPVSQTEVLLQAMKDFNESLLKQRTFIQEDRKDIAIARQQYLLINKDSLKYKADSILDRRLDLEYKRLMNKK